MSVFSCLLENVRHDEMFNNAIEMFGEVRCDRLTTISYQELFSQSVQVAERINLAVRIRTSQEICFAICDYLSIENVIFQTALMKLGCSFVLLYPDDDDRFFRSNFCDLKENMHSHRIFDPGQH